MGFIGTNAYVAIPFSMSREDVGGYLVSLRDGSSQGPTADGVSSLKILDLGNSDSGSETVNELKVIDGTKNFLIPGSNSYTVKAGDTTYFSLGTEWDNIIDTYSLDAAGKNMFDYFNKPALDDAVTAGKEIQFSHDPEAYGECALKWEWDYLQERYGYFALEKRGDFWYATK